MTAARNWLATGVAGFIFALAALGQSAGPTIPHLEKRDGVTQLIVDGKSFLILGGELYNSSASSLRYMQPIWPKLAAMNLNTVLAPVSWELIEPQEGKFDFALVDGLMSAAREHKLRLVFLWFGSWKNTYSSYVPEWVKRDTRRFPRVLRRNGQPTERLSPFSDTNRQADARAFGELMKHVRAVDMAQTVITAQVENEVGVIPDSRDFSPGANAAFRKPVPKALTDYLQKNIDSLEQELRSAWIGAGKKASGSWTEVFGDAAITDDFFMAWHFAAYIDAVTAAGKAQYPLPMFTNAALIRSNYQPGQYNSGGPLPHSIDIYRVAAPHLDFFAPDIYFDDFVHWASRYQRDGNPVFVPEAFGGSVGAANALYVFGQLNGIGFSPFGIEGTMSLSTGEKLESIQRSMANVYSVLSHLSPLILEKQGTSDMAAMVLEGEAQRNGRLFLGGYEMAINRSQLGGDRVAVLFICTGPDQFIVAGSGASQVSFSPHSDGPPNAGIASIDEEVFEDGKWSVQRRLNGDESAQGQLLKVNGDGAEKPVIYEVRLYRF